jgi:signal transduction histidine kinase
VLVTALHSDRAPLGWWRSRSELFRDIIGAAAFTGVAFLPFLADSGVALGELPHRHSGALAAVLALAQVLPLAVRRRWPAACLALVGTGFAVYQCLGYPSSFSSVGFIVALYASGAYQRRFRRGLAVIGTAAYVAVAIVLALEHSPERAVDYVTFYLVLACAWGAGAVLRARQLGEAGRRRHAAEQAVASERARIARELHDVVTHHVTAMVVQADAARFLPAGAHERVAGELREVSTTGRRALTELRYMLNLLDTARPDEQPTFSTGRLRDLVDQTRQAGQPVSLVEEGSPVPLSDAAELSAYRVVQESLTNALKHATGNPTLVRVRSDANGVDIDVTTDGPVISAFTAGRGLTGLRERVGQRGGSLDAGANPGGGFRVHARVPALAGRPGPASAAGRLERAGA